MLTPYVLPIKKDVVNLAVLIPQYSNDLKLLNGDMLSIQKGTKVLTSQWGKLHKNTHKLLNYVHIFVCFKEGTGSHFQVVDKLFPAMTNDYKSIHSALSAIEQNLINMDLISGSPSIAMCNVSDGHINFA